MTQWTREPPKEPGFYWMRSTVPGVITQHEVIKVFEHAPGLDKPLVMRQGIHGFSYLFEHESVEYWPVPVAPPTEDA